MEPGFVSLKGVSHRYGGIAAGPDGFLAVEDLTININRGEFAAVVGPSGCGKSTLMKLATGLQFPFAGHVHDPQLFNLSGLGKIADFTPTPEVSIPVPPHRQWLALPGSAGQPRDGNPAACWAMFDVGQALLTFHRVPYDHDAAARKILAAGLHPFFAERLALGR